MPDHLKRSFTAALSLLLLAWTVSARDAHTSEPRPETSRPADQAVTLTFEVASEQEREASEVLVVLTPQAPGSGAARVLAVEVPGRLTVGLPAGSLWSVEVRSDAYWAPETGVLARADSPPAPIRLHPAGEVSGTARVVGGDTPLPPDLVVSFQPVHPAGPLTRGLSGDETCLLREDGRWSCRLPAGTYDLRLKGEGFASSFRWQVEVPAGGVAELGRLSLRPGAALFGFVETAGRPLATQTVKVTLSAVRPRTSDHLVGRRLDAMGLDTGVDEHGFFHFHDVIPGPYRVSVAAEGFATLRTPPVEVLPGLETDLARPLVLQEAAQLNVWIDPPIHPTDDSVWTVRLQPRDLDQPAVEVDTDETGTAVLEGLAAGPYRLYVGGPDDARWEDRPMDLQPGVQSLSIDLPIVPVEGTITRDGEPVRARITFGERLGRKQIPMVSDPQGRFRGCLPEEGEWPVTLLFEPGGAQQAIEPVTVERSGDEAAEVDIEVPDTWVSGRVVDAAGHPVVQADVEATRPEAAKPDRKRPGLGLATSYVRSDVEGRFHFQGLPEGDYVVEALRDSQSGRTSVEVREAVPSRELRITLGATRELRGRIVGDRGPVAGAQVYGIPLLGSNRSFPVAQAVTDPLGEFRLSIPQDTLHLTLLALPYGHVPRILSWVPGDESEQELEIAVGDVGGTLVLAGTHDRRPSVSAWLEHRGLSIPLMLLHGWLLLHGGHPGDDVPWVLPAMPVGEYRLCGSLETAPCDGGVLSPGGRLDLAVDPPETQDAGGGRELSAAAFP